MPRLRDIDPDEISIVTRGAIRRRFSLLKTDDVPELELDPQFAEVLEKSADGERQLHGALDGADVDTARAAVAAYRLLKAYESESPVLKAAVDQMLGRAAPRPSPSKKPQGPERPDPARRAREAVAIAKAERADNDRNAETDLNRIVERIRKEEGFRISKERAYVAALATDQGRELYTRMRRHELRKAGIDVDQDIDPPASDVPVALAKAANELQAADEALTREQALDKACQADPSLYEAWRNA